jgi:hypothetical protein
MGGVAFWKRREPRQGHNGGDMGHRVRLQERQRAKMAEAAAVFGRVLTTMLECERGGLGGDYGAEEQQNDNGSRPARLEHLVPILQRKGLPSRGAPLGLAAAPRLL